ncbi:polysaccharide deacetylase family protein [Persicirhabdus sediminis]|uniref:Polysaccharide deacetylase family protein n=1 Tax=Persicirhabdus sediminis TaxID=454144 RepID=A0A8J7MF57_9BACT|nr:polysaccharide deacetylase family protein [Persicirhabdus sediminis]MBK1791585.1 polysaccharide deacetylase family protein [Persicirhabdus sediminis]
MILHLKNAIIAPLIALGISSSWADNEVSAGTSQQKIVDDGTRVTVLGYHDFSSEKEATEMLLPTDKFEKQLQALRELEIEVISLEQFLAWKNDDAPIPPKSALITIDDGWRNVYTEAYPLLKQYNYPFTLFLYQDFIDKGELSLTTEMIVEMQKNGCSIGNHSVTHPYPSKVKKHAEKGQAAYEAFIRTELEKSKNFLSKKFNTQVTTYAYPGGYYTEEMFPIADDLGYDALFTVEPGKVDKTTNNHLIPRYIVLGTHDSIFRNATTFQATQKIKPSAGALIQQTPYPVQPEPGVRVADRLPTITVDLKQLDNIDPESIVMRVEGFGRVPASYDNLSKSLSWKVNRRLRHQSCNITVQWKLIDGEEYEEPLKWSFIVDHEAAYEPAE